MPRHKGDRSADEKKQRKATKRRLKEAHKAIEERKKQARKDKKSKKS